MRSSPQDSPTSRPRCGFSFFGLVLVCAATTIASGASAVVIRHDRSYAEHDFLTHPGHGVGIIFVELTDITYLCTATAISGNIVVTAAHCFDALPDPASPGNAVLFSFDGSTGWRANQVAIHPDYEPASALNDIALVRFPFAFTNAWQQLTPFDFNEVDSIATFAGFGLTGSGTTGSVPNPPGYRINRGDLRGGQSRISGTDAGGTELLARFDDPRWGGSSALDLEAAVANGDSGGPWFVDAGGHDYLVGVTSGLNFPRNGPTPRPRYGDTSRIVRVRAYRDWIDAYVQAYRILPQRACMPNKLPLCIEIGPYLTQTPDLLPEHVIDALPTELPLIEVPEPSEPLLLASGLFTLVGLRRSSSRRES